MPRPRFTRRELNYLLMIYIVVKLFPDILVKVFKTEWEKWTSLTWRDNPQSGGEFWARESSENKDRNKEKRRTIERGDSSNFDSSLLFYLILNSDSIGSKLKEYDRDVYYTVNKLRKLRNEVVHRSKIEVATREFDDFFAEVKGCLRHLGFGTHDLENIKTIICFDEKEGDNLREKLQQEKQQLQRYEEYFTWRNSNFEEFSRRYNKRRISTSDLREKGILSDRDVEKLDKQSDKKLKNAMLVDCILHKGLTTTSVFLNTLHQTDSKLAESFTNTLPHSNLTSLTTVSPESLQKASCEYPKNYRAIMLDFTRYIYSMDWESMDRQGQLFLKQSQDWSAKLFVMIELAYGYNVRGESEKAIDLLEEVTRDAFKAGPNCARILSRTYSRKSLHYIHVHRLEKAEAFASEANTLISSIESPEEQIVGLKRITDCILYEDGSVAQRREKSWPIYSKIIEMCRRHIDDVPRCTYYLRFVYHDMARLCLGFTRNGFVETTLDEIEEGEKHLNRLEEQDLKTSEENTYTDAFRFICKSIAAVKRGKLTKNNQQRQELWNEGLRHRCDATNICNALNNENNEAMFMLNSLNKYITNVQMA